jgi:RHS repeat-associated protein
VIVREHLRGEYTDAETGFTYLRARYYDPGTGQFISRDPLTSVTGSPYAGEPAQLDRSDGTGQVPMVREPRWRRP